MMYLICDTIIINTYLLTYLRSRQSSRLFSQVGKAGFRMTQVISGWTTSVRKYQFWCCLYMFKLYLARLTVCSLCFYFLMILEISNYGFEDMVLVLIAEELTIQSASFKGVNGIEDQKHFNESAACCQIYFDVNSAAHSVRVNILIIILLKPALNQL